MSSCIRYRRAKNLPKRPAKKRNQRTYALLSQRVISVRRRCGIESDCQAVEQNAGGSTQFGDVEFASSGAAFDYSSDLLQQKFPEIAHTFPTLCTGKAQ
jgi:hypothetical protein